MKIIKILWNVIAFIWLVYISTSLLVNLDSAQSAVQASQLYNEATTVILGIIAVTLLLYLPIDTKKETQDNEQPINNLSQLINLNNDILTRIEKRLSNLSPKPLDPSNVITQTCEDEKSSGIEIINKPVEIKNCQKVLTTTKGYLPQTIKPNILCPKCNSPMNVRTSNQGEFKGKQFYVCSNYPKCKEIRPI